MPIFYAMNLKRNTHGFSLVELTLTVIILSLILSFSVSNLSLINQTKTLTAATESLYNTLKLAKSESIKQRINFNVSFITGNNWCFGMSDAGSSCNCSQANSCQVNGIEKVINFQNHGGIILTINNLSGNSPNYVEFEGIRGTVTDTGSINLSNSSYSTTLSVNKLGLLSICSDSVRSYSSCTP